MPNARDDSSAILPYSSTPAPTSISAVQHPDAHYTIILGSHRNSCLKIEKNGVTMVQVPGCPTSRVTPRDFTPFWLDFDRGLISLGTGQPSANSLAYQWLDSDPIPNICHVGLSCWDSHVSYRAMRVLPACGWDPGKVTAGVALEGLGLGGTSRQGSLDVAGMGPGLPSLFELCQEVVADSLGQWAGAAVVCNIAQVAELLLPNTSKLHRRVLLHLAEHFQELATGSSPPPCTAPFPSTAPAVPEGLPVAPPPAHPCPCPELLRLPAPLLSELLSLNCIAMGEKSIFDAMVRWAEYHLQQGRGPGQQQQQQQQQATFPSISNASSSSSSSSGGGVSEDAGGGQCCIAATSTRRPCSTSPNGNSHARMLPSSLPSPHPSSSSPLSPSPSPSSPPADCQRSQASTAAACQDTRRPAGCPKEASLLPAGRLGQCLDLDRSQEGGESQRQQGHAGGDQRRVGCGQGQEGHQVQGQAGQKEESGVVVCPSANSVVWGVTAAASEEEVGLVLGLVRFPLMTHEELADVWQHPLVHRFPSVLALLEEAACLPGGVTQVELGVSYKASGLLALANKRLLHSNEEMLARGNLARFQRRLPPSGHECTFCHEGDQNGVLRFIGTLYGTQAWMNPALAKRVELRASSPAGRHTDPKALAGEKFLHTNFAGPRYLNGEPDSWWLLDLGPCHRLTPTHYTMRHDASSDFPRHWVLQASGDGADWTDLSVHRADCSLRKPGQYASWPVLGPSAQTAYRLFRLRLTGPTTNPHQAYAFPLAYWEMYGAIYRVPPPATPPLPPQPPAQPTPQLPSVPVPPVPTLQAPAATGLLDTTPGRAGRCNPAPAAAAAGTDGGVGQHQQ